MSRKPFQVSHFIFLQQITISTAKETDVEAIAPLGISCTAHCSERLSWSFRHAFATDAAWARLQRGGYTILIQGADASGTLSPTVDNSVDCSATQTLSDRGRQLAQKLGARFAARGVRIDKVLPVRPAMRGKPPGFPSARYPPKFSSRSIHCADEAAKQSQIEQIRAVISGIQGFRQSGNDDRSRQYNGSDRYYAASDRGGCGFQSRGRRNDPYRRKNHIRLITAQALVFP